LQLVVFQRLKLQKKCAEVYEGQTKTHPALAGSGTSAQIILRRSRLRPDRDPDNPKKSNKAEQRDEGHADGIGVGQDHSFLSSRRKMPSQFSLVLN
jgi:hypothetical protein